MKHISTTDQDQPATVKALHSWSALMMEPVEVIVVEGELHIFSQGEVAYAYGCCVCNQPLSAENANEECPGDDEDEYYEDED